MSHYMGSLNGPVPQKRRNVYQNADEDGAVIAQSNIPPFDMLVPDASYAAAYCRDIEWFQWQMEYPDQEASATFYNSFGPQPQASGFQHPDQESFNMLHNLCQIGPQSSTAYPAYLNLCEDPTPSQGLAPLAWDANVGYNDCMPYQWSQTHFDHIDHVDPQLEDLSTMLHGSCSIGSQPQIQTSMSEAHPTCLDDMGSFFTPRELGMLEGATPTSQMPPLLVSDVDARLNGCMPYQWSQTHLDHIDHVDPQLEDLSTMLHGSCSIGPQPQIQISMPEAHPTCLDDMGSFFTPRELGMLEGATTTSPMSPLLVSDVDARLNGCMPWSQTHPNHVDRIDPQFDENPWGSQQIAHHSTANYAPAPLRPPGPLPVQPTRVVAGIKHGTVIEQTPYQVTRQRRRNEQLRVKFFRSNGRPGIRLSQPEDLLDDKTEVSFVGGKGPKMSYRIRFPGGHNPINEQKNVTLRGPRRVLTHEKMVKQVIEVIIKFIETNSNVVLAEESKQWKFGGDGITLENLVLLSVEQVSNGSLQPCLMYVDPGQPW